MNSILQALGQIFGPLLTLFHYVFYLPVFNILMGIYMVVHSYALAIVVLTVLLRVALIPLTRAQLKSQQEMQKLAPELARLKREHPNDPQAQMQAQQALYREHGVSPMKGCLPLLVQMPFLYAMYNSFNTVLRAPNVTTMLSNINNDLYPFMPHLTMHTLPNFSFFWASLAAPDPLHILPVLAALLTFLQLRMAMPVKRPQPRGGQADATTQAAGTMQYMMPFITLFIGWSFPAGLALYWCVSTLFSAVQQYFLNGNFGSLFVGIPGMEHLVPPPKDLATQTALPPPRGRTTARLGAPAIAALAPEPSTGGLRGLWQQLRQSAAAQTQAQADAAAAATASVNASESDLPRSPRRGNGTGGPGPRRPRPVRQGAMLVRPALEPFSTANELPEDEIARAGSSALNGKQALPEQMIARESAHYGRNGQYGAGSNGAGSNGAGSNGAGSNGAGSNGFGFNGATTDGAPRSTEPSSGPSTPARGPTAPYTRKGSPSGRRGGRPKGGR